MSDETPLPWLIGWARRRPSGRLHPVAESRDRAVLERRLELFVECEQEHGNREVVTTVIFESGSGPYFVCLPRNQSESA